MEQSKTKCSIGNESLFSTTVKIPCVSLCNTFRDVCDFSCLFVISLVCSPEMTSCKGYYDSCKGSVIHVKFLFKLSSKDREKIKITWNCLLFRRTDLPLIETDRGEKKRRKERKKERKEQRENPSIEISSATKVKNQGGKKLGELTGRAVDKTLTG